EVHAALQHDAFGHELLARVDGLEQALFRCLPEGQGTKKKRGGSYNRLHRRDSIWTQKSNASRPPTNAGLSSRTRACAASMSSRRKPTGASSRYARRATARRTRSSANASKPSTPTKKPSRRAAAGASPPARPGR